MSNLKFECPICGNNKYKLIETDVVTDVIVHRSQEIDVEKSDIMLGCECTKCSVLFGNPAKFTKNREIVAPQAETMRQVMEAVFKPDIRVTLTGSYEIISVMALSQAGHDFLSKNDIRGKAYDDVDFGELIIES